MRRYQAGELWLHQAPGQGAELPATEAAWQKQKKMLMGFVMNMLLITLGFSLS